MTLPKTMRAMALERFGGPERLAMKELPVPEASPGEVLIRVETAGVGEWDPFEREGGYAEMLGLEPGFPYVLGSECSGTVAAVGEQVTRFQVGDRVYTAAFLNPQGGCYAEYVAVDAGLVSLIPAGVTVEQAGVMAGVGLTALRGLEDTLELKAGESILVFGASGGVGHLALQIAKRKGARVLAAASGADGVALARRLGSDAVVDGRQADVLAAARAFAPEGLDAALLTAGGEAAECALEAMRPGGRVAYPFGIRPEPRAIPDVQLGGYYGNPDEEILTRFTKLFASGPLSVHVARTFPLEQAAEAHRALDAHYLGKLALQVS